MFTGVSLLAIQTNILEVAFFGVIALIIGFVIHYLWSIRNGSSEVGEFEKQQQSNEAHQWRLKYYELTEQKQQNLDELQEQLQLTKQKYLEAKEEMEELQELNTQLLQKPRETVIADVDTNDYLQQLKIAQEHLLEHNEGIARLLQQSESLEQVQEKYRQTNSLNEALNHQLLAVQNKLQDKDEEIQLIKHRSAVTSDMKQQLETAYTEFHDLQEKLQHVQLQLKQPAGEILKNEELEEANEILRDEIAASRYKQKELTEENSRLTQDVIELQDKLREAEFQKQQIAKRNEFLEQLNQDLQEVTDQNKRMETQMRRLTEIESMLSKISENKQHL